MNRRERLGRFLVCALAAALLTSKSGVAHPFVPQAHRVGTFPKYDGGGWFGEAFLNLPDAAVVNLREAATYVVGRTPDFTFHTDWIDFPAGPVAFRRDSDFAVMGDFLDDYIENVSDPSKLDAPFGNFFLRFMGLWKISFADETRIDHPSNSLPIWADFGSMGYDGFGTVAGRVVGPFLPVTCYRTMNANTVGPWNHFGPGVELPGLYPIEVTYFNKYDPTGTLGAPFAGFELYSWLGDGAAWPSGENAIHAVFGPMRLASPEFIYAGDDALTPLLGDFDADLDFDMVDVQGMMNCLGGADFLAAGCDWMDFDLDVDIDEADFFTFLDLVEGPR